MRLTVARLIADVKKDELVLLPGALYGLVVEQLP